MAEVGVGGGADLRRPMASLRIAASGLAAQRARLDTVAMNIANAESTRGPDGGPYRRRVVVMEEAPFQPALERAARGAEEPGGGVLVAGVEEDASLGPLVYDPGHPHADDRGYVRMPNVNMTEEMADLMEARRHFEANATVLEAVKKILRRATQL